MSSFGTYQCPHCGGTAIEHSEGCPKKKFIDSFPPPKPFDPEFEFEMRVKEDKIAELQRKYELSEEVVKQQASRIADLIMENIQLKHERSKNGY